MKPDPLYHVAAGSHLVLDGRPWRVTGKDRNSYAVEGLEDGECLTLAFSRVDQAVREGTCEITTPAEEEKRRALLEFTGGYELFHQLPEEQQDIVRARLPVVLAIRDMEAEGWKLTQRAMSRDPVTGSIGSARIELMRRARAIAQDDRIHGSARAGRVSAGFDWPQGRTLRKYADLFVQYDNNPVVLLDRDHRKGPQGEDRQRLSTWQEKFIAYVLNTWQRAQKPKLATVVGNAQTTFHVPPVEYARGFSFPSITTIRARAKAISTVVSTVGRRGLRQGANLVGAGSTDVRALMYGEKAEIDQVYLSIFTDATGAVVGSEIDPATAGEDLEANEICRLWLHVLIDVATRLPLAWIIAESADADHSHALLRMATRDKTKEKVRYDCKRDPAPPAGLLLSSADNGTATRNGSVYAAQLGTGTIVMTGRTYHATDKPYVERLFGTMQFQVLNFLPGYTGSRPGELEGYNPKDSAGVNPDALYGILTRYFVDEYPFRPHRGTGMFGATPWQKFEETVRLYGGIAAPSARERCLHLGVKREMSTTSEGVNPFGIPFNSSALQRFADGQSKKVTVHIDPGFMKHAYVTAEGLAEVIKVDLSMTAFNDLTLEEILDLMTETAKANPKQRELHDRHLKEAKARRVRESGFFTDSRAPESYRTIEKLQKQADRLRNVAFKPVPVLGPTAAPGGVMDRTGAVPVHRVGPPAAAPPPAAPGTEPMTFPPIKDSKL